MSLYSRNWPVLINPCTHSGKSDLDVPIAIRPTSETVMYPYYGKVRRCAPRRLRGSTKQFVLAVDPLAP